MSTEYIFFSVTNHGASIGVPTYDYVHAVTKEVRQANYKGTKIGGLPGWMENGQVVRPPNVSTYTIIGEVAPGKWELVPGQTPIRKSSRFARRSDFCDPS